MHFDVMRALAQDRMGEVKEGATGSRRPPSTPETHRRFSALVDRPRLWMGKSRSPRPFSEPARRIRVT